MSLTISAEITGIKDLMNMLKKFTPAVQRRILRPALNAEGQRVLVQARSNVPVDTKLLKRSLGKRTKTYKDGRVIVIVGPRRGFREIHKGRPKNPSNYAHLVEFGAAPHTLKVHSARLASSKGQKFQQMHPGAPAQKPLTRAYQTALNGAAERMASRMAQEIEKLAAKGKLKVS